MPEDTKQSFDVINLTTWIYQRRKSLIGVVSVIAAVAIVYGLYAWHGKAREDSANDAFAALKLPPIVASESPTAAAPYLKLAEDYPSSSAAARSLIIAGGILFNTGKYPEAQRAFEKYLVSYRDYPFTSGALFGVAASLDAQGKTADAVQRYESLLGRGQDYVTIPAMAALARLYIEQNKPEAAVRKYAELMQFNVQDSWTAEAQDQVQELLQKHPELRQKLQQQQQAAPAAQPGPRS